MPEKKFWLRRIVEEMDGITPEQVKEGAEWGGEPKEGEEFLGELSEDARRLLVMRQRTGGALDRMKEEAKDSDEPPEKAFELWKTFEALNHSFWMCVNNDLDDFKGELVVRKGFRVYRMPPSRKEAVAVTTVALPKEVSDALAAIGSIKSSMQRSNTTLIAFLAIILAFGIYTMVLLGTALR